MNEQTCPWAIKDADGKTIGIGVPVINNKYNTGVVVRPVAAL